MLDDDGDNLDSSPEASMERIQVCPYAGQYGPTIDTFLPQ